MKKRGKVGRNLRRGTACVLLLAGLWAAGAGTELSAVGRALAAEEQGAGVTWLTRRLGPLPGEETGLSGRGRLLLRASALLAQGEGLTAAVPAPEPEPTPDSHPEQEEDTHPLQPADGAAAGEEDDIISITAQGQTGGKYLSSGGVYLFNRTEKNLDAGVLDQGSVDLHLGEGPQILIVHTHGSEAYSQSDGDRYEESDAYRTTDCTHNMVRVGEEMATVFRAHGLSVIHDTTLFDYPAYNGSYDRSRAAVERWLAEYPSLQIVLDVHRDAMISGDGRVYKVVTQEAGRQMAQVMLVVGSDDSGQPHPRWKDNLALAVALQRGLVRGYASLARPIVLRSSRFNQQLSPGSLLVEVGGHGNTLTEAVEAARLWADNVARTLLKLGG